MGYSKSALMLGLLTAIFACALTSCKSDVAAPVASPTVPIATAEPTTLANDLTLSAEFKPYQEVDVMAKIAGYVKNIRVDIGDHVQQGEMLATLEVPEIQDELAKAKAGVETADANIVTAQANVTHAQAVSNIAHLSYERIRDVAAKDKGLVPRQDVDVAQSRDLEAAAQLASVNSAVKAAQEMKSGAESEYSRAQAMVQYATIRAPFTGVVTKRYANTG
jgi:multidrug efflux pump subunit AcrA (membrane-fusion protein)